MNSTKLFRNFLQCGSGILLFLVILAGSLCAQTEIVGEVSGVWDIEGSPYLVWDSTWVRQNRTLRIEPGVEVLFEENWGLWVNGSLIARGAEDDSIRFRSANEGSDWRGIFMLRALERLQLDYCVYTGSPNGITLGDSLEIDINHSVITADQKTLGGTRRGGNDVSWNCVMSINNSVILGNPCIDNVNYLSLEASNSIFNKNLWGNVGLTAINCIFYDDVDVEYSEYFDCRFIDSGDPINERKIVVLTGDMENCSSEIQVIIPYGHCRIQNLESSSSIVGFGGLEMDFCTTTKLEIVSTNDRIMHISNCTIGDRVDIRTENTPVEISKSVIFGGANIRGGGESPITIDSCEFHEKYPLEFLSAVTLSNDSEDSDILVSRSIITLPMNIRVRGSFTFVNNTIHIPDSIRGFAVHSVDRHYNSLVYTNNIFTAAREDLPLFWIVIADEIPPVFGYNLVYGFEDIFFHDDAEFEIDSTNLEEDPLFFNVDSLDFHLTENSPCIDAGDPDSPFDPDGTRADIGALYFPHGNFVPEYSDSMPSIGTLVSVYPNPCNSHFIIRNKHNQKINFSIVDIVGRKILTHELNTISANSSFNYDTKNLSTGMYFIKIENGNAILTNRLMVQK